MVAYDSGKTRQKSYDEKCVEETLKNYFSGVVSAKQITQELAAVLFSE
jgi:hypothetical protein